MTGSGLIMRFADLDGTTIDTCQAHTHMTDEAGQAYPSTIDFLLDDALGANGFYGMFSANMHTDDAESHPGSDAIVASAQARGVPVITAKQALDWVDGRDTLDAHVVHVEPATARLQRSDRGPAHAGCGRCCRRARRPAPWRRSLATAVAGRRSRPRRSRASSTRSSTAQDGRYTAHVLVAGPTPRTARCQPPRRVFVFWSRSAVCAAPRLRVTAEHEGKQDVNSHGRGGPERSRRDGRSRSSSGGARRRSSAAAGSSAPRCSSPTSSA